MIFYSKIKIFKFMLNDGGVADSLLYVKYECVKVL